MTIFRISPALLLLASAAFPVQSPSQPVRPPTHRPLSPIYALDLPFGASVVQVLEACRRYDLIAADSDSVDGEHLIAVRSYNFMGTPAQLVFHVSNEVGFYRVSATVSMSSGGDARSFYDECVESLGQVLGPPNDAAESRLWWEGTSSIIWWDFDTDADAAHGHLRVEVYSPVESRPGGSYRIGFVWSDQDRTDRLPGRSGKS